MRWIPVCSKRYFCYLPYLLDRGQFIFCTKDDRPYSRYQVWALLKRIATQAGIDPHRVFPHNLRRLFAVTYYEKTRDIVRLADILGHSSIETTRLYLVTSGQEHTRQLDSLHLVT